MQSGHPEHTYGPSCHFARNVDSRRTGLSTVKGEEGLPPLNAQFFHTSPLPIDDPLSAIPNPGGSDSKSTSQPTIPFSGYDNNALEEAWQKLSVDEKSRANRKTDKVEAKAQAEAQRAARKAERRSTTADMLGTKERRAQALRQIGNDHVRIHGKESVKRYSLAVPNERPSMNQQPLQYVQPAPITPSQFVGTEPEVSDSVSPPCCRKLESDTRRIHKFMFLGTSKRHRDRKVDRNKFFQEACQEVQKQQRTASGGGAQIPTTPPPTYDGANSRLADPTPLRQAQLSPEGFQLVNTVEESDVPRLRDFPSFMHTGDAAGESSSSDSETASDTDSDSSDVGVGTSDRERCRRTNTRVRAETYGIQGDAAGDDLTPMAETDPSTALPVKDSEPPLHDVFDIQKALEDDGARKAAEKAADKHQRSRDHVRYEKHMQSEEHQMGEEDESHTLTRGHRKFLEHAKAHEGESSNGPQKSTNSNIEPESKNPAVAQVSETSYGSSMSNADTTGHPFLRALPFSRPKPSDPRPPAAEQHDSDSCHDEEDFWLIQHKGQTATKGKETINAGKGCKARKSSKQFVEVPVGASRLHLVQLPALQMKPIYWNRAHDISAVIRGTWFHKDTMLPVECTVANQLEKGYRELRPWSQTWKDELSSALEVGAAGEEKISHRLWPKETSAGAKSSHEIPTDPYCAARCFNGQAAAAGFVDADSPENTTPRNKTFTKRYPNSHVIYKDAQNAFILKTSLQPSAYYSRRPLAKIMKNTTVGMHVIRGFDWAVWEKLHPSKKKTVAQKKTQESEIPQSGNANTAEAICMACRQQEQRPKISDLVLVIHGIGQKLSERVESFAFTHAINAFRRSINIELANDAVQHVFREDLGGVMVLPVNWREKLSFEKGGAMKAGDHTKAEDSDDFGLKDITPEGIPAVRGFITDVLLDIPFYMSHHKPEMLRALISEANRIYRLWCKNNPGFSREGRVHLIAHSLGSVMALDALSKQPTFVTPGKLDILDQMGLGHKIQTKCFDFDTKNLFLVGSPSAFFLYLKKARLMPRAGRNKPGALPEDDAAGVAGDEPGVGCLAVDNIFNVMHPNDPVAYQLNATVDVAYAKSLKTAQVPSSATSILSYMGKAVSGFIPGRSAPKDVPVGELAPTKPSMDRLPSQLEMEVHDFSREEIAEKKFYRLNDNGQIDWFLSPGSGTIEYLNMLGAHSSYWGHPDFIRMVVTEIGRKPGKNCTLPNMRAVKVNTTAKKLEKPSSMQ